MNWTETGVLFTEVNCKKLLTHRSVSLQSHKWFSHTHTCDSWSALGWITSTVFVLISQHFKMISYSKSMPAQLALISVLFFLWTPGNFNCVVYTWISPLPQTGLTYLSFLCDLPWAICHRWKDRTVLGNNPWRANGETAGLHRWVDREDCWPASSARDCLSLVPEAVTHTEKHTLVSASRDTTKAL